MTETSDEHGMPGWWVRIEPFLPDWLTQPWVLHVIAIATLVRGLIVPILKGFYDRNLKLLGNEALDVLRPETDDLTNLTNAERVRRDLRPRRLGASYRERLETALDWLDARLPRSCDVDYPGQDFRNDVNRVLSNGALDFSLLVAVAYPFLALFIEYSFFGGTGRLGGIEVFDDDFSATIRPLVFVGALFSFGAMGFALRTDSLRAWPMPFRLLTKGLLLVFSSAAVTVAGAVAGAGALAVAFVVTGAGAFAFAGAFAGAFAVTAGVTFTGVVAFAVAGAGALTFTGVVTDGVTFGVTGAVAVAAFAFREGIRGRKLVYPFLAVAIAITAGVVARWPDDLGDASMLVFFVVILTLCNAIFDWLSFGCTRLLLRRGLLLLAKPSSSDQHPLRRALPIVLISLLDVVVAALLLIGLGMSIVLFTAFCNWLYGFNPDAVDGQRFIDLAEKFAIIKGEGEDRPQWLYAVHFSTFVPSFLHLCLMLLTLAPGWVNGWMADQVTPDLKNQTWKKELIAGWLVLRGVLLVLVAIAPILLLATDVGANAFRAFGALILAPIEGFAALLGQV